MKMKGRGNGQKGKAPKKIVARPALGVPDKATLLAFLNQAKTSLAPRDIAIAFGIKGDDKRALKALLRELAESGDIAKTGRKDVASQAIPPDGGLFQVIEINTHGELLARALGRDGDAFGPMVRLAHSKAQVRHDGPPPGVGDRFIGKTRQTHDGEYEVSVIKRLGRVIEKTFGVFLASDHRLGQAGSGGGRIQPADKKLRHELQVAPEHAKGAKNGDLVAARLLRHRGFGPKKAEIIEIFGHSEDPKAASILAIAAHSIPMGFSVEEEEEAQRAGPASLHGREDLRHIPLVTIDPEDARDHDDAVYAQALPGGGHKILVAIADVAFYVTPGSALDEGALMRGNSVYFPDRVVPMLPERLSADLCSLKHGVERPCLALEILIDAHGIKQSHRFLRGLMKSAASLTYRQAQSAVDGLPDDITGPLLEPVLNPLWAAYRALEKARTLREPLEINSPERKIVLSPEGKVVSIALADRFDAHRLIEEMMILSNVCAAETLEDKRSPLIYRVHDQPSATKLAALGDFLASVDMKWAKGQPPTPARFNQILTLAAPTENAEMINEIVLRTQAQAIYDTDNLGHFGLNLRKYAHFTSPIRRYADLIVHRALISALHLGHDGLKSQSVDELKRIAQAITTTERRAMAAERDATDRYVAAFLSERVGAVFDGRITSVNRFGLFVRLVETGGDGLIPVMRLGPEYFHHDEAGHALIGSETGDRWELGAKVQVRLMEAVPVSGGLLFDMVSAPKVGPVPGRRALRGPQRATTPRKVGGPPRGVTRRR